MKRFKISADINTTAAALASLIPGFLLPFVISWRLGPGQSDTILLALSIMTTYISTMSIAIELNTIGEFGRNLTKSTCPTGKDLKKYSHRIYRLAYPALIIITTILTLSYSINGNGKSSEFILICGLMMLAPAVSIPASIQSGVLISDGMAAIPIATQFFRPTIGMLFILIWPDSPLWILPIGFAIGESTRWYILRQATQRALSRRKQIPSDPMDTGGLYWQASSAAVSQGAPVVDRIFLTAAPAGSVSMYEMSDKVFYAAIQILNYGFLARRVGGWSRLRELSRHEANTKLNRDLALLMCVATAAALLGIACLCAIRLLPIPELWFDATGWAILALVSTPFTTWILSISRLVILSRRQRYLLWFSIGTICMNLLLDIFFFSLFGAYGIIIATVACRAVSAIGYSALYLKNIKPLLLSETAQ